MAEPYTPSTGAGAGVDDVEVVRPPVGLLAAAACCLVVSVAVFFVDRVAVHVAGYLLGSLCTVALLGGFRLVDMRARRSPWYAPEPWVRWAWPALAVGAVAVAALHAWPLAVEVAS